jgi:hypothetical protein
MPSSAPSSSCSLFKASWVLALAAALAVLAGCPEGERTPTYHTDIAPLFAEQCTSCHQDGGIAPFPLVTYAQARDSADAAAAFVSARLMPPSNVDASGSCRTYQDARWLTDEQIALVEAWAAAGAPEGPKPKTPPVIAPPDTLDDATLFVEMAEPYTPRGSAQHPNDDYRCFFLTGPDADSFLTGFEIVPGQPHEVHHMLLFALTSDGTERIAQNLDDESPEPGWDCFSTPVGNDINLLAGWAPGDDVLRYPAGTGLAVPGGRRLVMQIHYNLLGGEPAPDVTALKLRLAPSVQKEAALVPIVDTDLVVPPGQQNAEFGFSVPLAGLSDDVDVHGVFPHMHTLGKTLRFDLHPLGSTNPDNAFCLADVPRWDFHWQQLFLYEDPVRVTAADVLNVRCTFDTTSRTSAVRWGEGTEDEMCLVFVYITAARGGMLSEL